MEQLREILLLTVGYTEEELAGLDLAQMSTDDLRQLLKQKIPHEDQTNNAPLQNGNNGRKQRVLDPNEAAGLINSGACEFVGNLPGGRVVVREM